MDLAKYARRGWSASAFVGAMLLAAVIAVPGSRAMAGTPGTPAVALTCSGATQHVGPFDVVCGGSGSRFVQVTAAAVSCQSAGGALSSCGFRYWIKRRGTRGWDTISFAGGSVSQVGLVSAKGGTGSGGSTTTTTTSSTGGTGSGGTSGSAGPSTTTTVPTPGAPRLVFRQISWTSRIRVPGPATRVVTIVVTTGVGYALTSPSYGVQDSKNIADGAAQQVAGARRRDEWGQPRPTPRDTWERGGRDLTGGGRSDSSGGRDRAAPASSNGPNAALIPGSGGSFMTRRPGLWVMGVEHRGA
ncbi:MAG: hypothetical protein ACP5OV_07890 [Acidimicrobiales bacterium]